MDIMYFNRTSDHSRCWIRTSNNRYILHDPGHWGEHDLPRLSVKYAYILKENNIPFRILEGNQEVEFWSPNSRDFIEDLTLPAYCIVGKQYCFLEWHSEWVPKKEAVDEAKEIFIAVIAPLLEDY